MDFVEVMEIAEGADPAALRLLGWRGVKVIFDDAYHK
jgi:hypothetical protein